MVSEFYLMGKTEEFLTPFIISLKRSNYKLKRGKLRFIFKNETFLFL
jgi:hypothetical protein